MSDDSFPKGCPGALWPNGDASETYCTNDKNYPWWQKCCKWTGKKCVPNGKRQACVDDSSQRRLV